MSTYQQFWWFLLIKGLLLFAAGLFLILSPENAVHGIAFYIGLILVTAGIISLWNTNQVRKTGVVGPAQYVGPIIALLTGMVLLFFPLYALTLLAMSVGLWVLLDGVFQIQHSTELNKPNRNVGLWLLFLGILSIILGVIIFFNPLEFVKLMTTLFGLVVLVSGGFMIALSFGMRR